MKENLPRKRRSRSIRGKIREQGKVRLTVHRTTKHIYAQIISAEGGKVLACASSVEKIIREKALKGKTAIANAVGALVAERYKGNNDDQTVAFDRSGFRFHGRIKALAESARAAGLQF